MYPHCIRLRAPWESEPLAGRIRFRRRFGSPRRIDTYERVWLTFTGVGPGAEVRLNGELLKRRQAHNSDFESEVTAILRDRNEVIVEVDASVLEPGRVGALYGDVALEVRCSAFLRGTRIWLHSTDSALRVYAAGHVVGVSDRPLELYLIVDRSTVAYSTVEADAAGKPFGLDSEEIASKGEGIGVELPQVLHARLDLVNGGVIWYTFEQEIEFRPKAQ